MTDGGQVLLTQSNLLPKRKPKNPDDFNIEIKDNNLEQKSDSITRNESANAAMNRLASIQRETDQKHMMNHKNTIHDSNRNDYFRAPNTVAQKVKRLIAVEQSSPFSFLTNQKQINQDQKQQILIDVDTPEPQIIQETIETIPSLWNDAIEDEFTQFSQSIKSQAQDCGKAAKRHDNFDIALKGLTIISGVIVTLTSISSVNSESRSVITAIGGAFSSVIASSQSILKYGKRAETEKFAQSQLEKMSRNIRLELARPQELRISPFDYITNLENDREKIEKSLDSNN